jgi:hypothetical protein
MNENSRVTVLVMPDELRLLQLLRDAEPDADLEVNRRDGRVVNCKVTTIHKRDFETTKLLEGAKR